MHPYDINCDNNNFTYRHREPLNKNSLPKNTHLLDTEFIYNIGFDLSGSSPSILSSSVPENLSKYRINNLDNTSVILNLNSDISNAYICKSSSNIRFRNRQPIYMEIDKLSLYDELNPYPKGSNNLYNNYSNSSVNTAFFKLPPTLNGYNSQDYSRVISNTNNIVLFFDPPLQRLHILKFKFRYHDGYLVNLNNQDINFTLEINQLRDEIPIQLNIRTPAL